MKGSPTRTIRGPVDIEAYSRIGSGYLGHHHETIGTIEGSGLRFHTSNVFGAEHERPLISVYDPREGFECVGRKKFISGEGPLRPLPEQIVQASGKEGAVDIILQVLRLR
jgi:hypothetical protein